MCIGGARLPVEPAASGSVFPATGQNEAGTMPRYFFNIRDGYDVDEDEEGVELPDLDAAKAEALATVEELRDELADAGNIELEITDETGRRLLTVPFFRGGRRR
jgi:hypothetical protein